MGRRPPGRARHLQSRPPAAVAAAAAAAAARRPPAASTSGAGAPRDRFRGARLKGEALTPGERCPPTERRPGRGVSAEVPSEPRGRSPRGPAVGGGGSCTGGAARLGAAPGPAPSGDRAGLGRAAGTRRGAPTSITPPHPGARCGGRPQGSLTAACGHGDHSGVTDRRVRTRGVTSTDTWTREAPRSHQQQQSIIPKAFSRDTRLRPHGSASFICKSQENPPGEPSTNNSPK
ncbi:translation initiation factor IF-2-like [Camelus ferus]|uniref:Translation initiation factor IF-2-like n=1 Tax=Camelus ferus TaxID=419612 RepID=A0A8B8UHQ3_CAMFR|nr:translation initiation factor IF-2-like [Camelus ferus]